LRLDSAHPINEIKIKYSFILVNLKAAAIFRFMDATDSSLSSLIITLADHPELRAGALATLTARDDLQLGEPGGAWLPAVLDATDARAAFREIEAIPGVVLVEVVFVELSHQTAAPADLPAFAS
jgi:hypothetical protein